MSDYPHKVAMYVWLAILSGCVSGMLAGAGLLSARLAAIEHRLAACPCAAVNTPDGGTKP